MKRLEFIVVQLEETKRLIEINRVPQLRLALILLDSAIELVLHRTVNTQLSYEPVQILANYRRAKESGRYDEDLDTTIQELEGLVTSQTQRKKLDSFDPKIDFLIRSGDLAAEIGPVIKKLHKYRNETYHRDQHREAVLRPAVLIYFDAACTVLSAYRTGIMSIDSDIGPEFGKYVDARGPLYTDVFELAGTVARQLRDALGLDLKAVRNALSDHLTARLDTLDSDIKFIEQNVDRELTREDVIRMAQVADGDMEAILDLEVLRNRIFRYSDRDIIKWRTEIICLLSIANKHEMFAKFAAIEDEFEPLELKVHEDVSRLDHAIQMQIDEYRGK